MKSIAVGAIALFTLLGASSPGGHGEGLTRLEVVRPQAPVILGDQERALLADVNLVRIKAGLEAVTIDDRLTQAARSHARDMAARSYFGHESPDGRSLVDRYAAVGFPWRVAAENIALDEDEPHAHDALLHSPDHRANILDPRVRKIGVAALGIARGSILYVEDFAL